MGRRVMGLIFMLFYSTMVATSALQEILATESNYHQQTHTEKYGKDGVTNQIGKRYSATASASTVSHGIGHGSAAGGDNGGGSRPHSGGGSAVIPVYAAGSAQARHRQGRPHNAGNCCENNMGLLVAAVLAAIAHLYRRGF